MAHGTTNMLVMKDEGEGLSVGVRAVDGARDVGQLDADVFAPFLDCKVLNVHVASARRRAILVGNADGGLTINAEFRGTLFFKA